jgi:hypothetical protein
VSLAEEGCEGELVRRRAVREDLRSHLEDREKLFGAASECVVSRGRLPAPIDFADLQGFV